MQKTVTAILALMTVVAAHADYSYTTTRKNTGGMMASMGGQQGPQTTHVYLKGQKMKVDSGNTATIMDFDAQTITAINNSQKTYTVKSFNELGAEGKAAGVELNIDSKETGQKKSVNGFSASEFVMTMEMDSPQQARQMGKMQMEMDMWISSDVPGSQEMRAFYQRNAAKFPWAAMYGGGQNAQLQQALADVQRKLASMNGVPVQQIIKLKAPGAMAAMGGGPNAAQSAQMQAGMAKARAQLEALKSQGGPAAAMAEQQLARMGGGTPAAGSASSGSLLEMTMDSADFSTSAIPDSIFALPEGYKKAN